jgi:membrane associated rhomboid family serine protease
MRYCYRHPDRETGLACSECGRPICYECMTPAPVGLRCPDHSGKPQGFQKVTRSVERAVTGVGGRRVNAVTMALIAINLVVYAAELAAGGTINGVGNWIFDHGALISTYQYADGSIGGVAQGEWWRLITSTFLHYGPLHLAMNMYSLFFAGSILEHVIDRWRFALLYLVSGLCGSAGALILTPDGLTAGASGAIFGVLGALWILERRGNIATGGQIAALLVINLVFTFGLASFISVGGHLGGLVGGVALMIAFLSFRRSALLALGSAVAIGGIAVAVALVAA